MELKNSDWSPKSFEFITSTEGNWIFTFKRPELEDNKKVKSVKPSCGCTNIVFNQNNIVATVNVESPKLNVQSTFKTITLTVVYEDESVDKLSITYKLDKNLNYGN